MKSPIAVILSLGCALCSFAADTLRIPIHVNKPDRLQTASWPLTFGIPFKQGEQHNTEELCIVDEKGTAVPCQIVKTGDWTDGSLRWASADFKAEFGRQYFLTRGTRAEAKDDIKLEQSDAGIVVATGGARYTFTKGAGCFDSIALDTNKDGKLTAEETLVANAGSAFYVIDSKDRRGVLKGTKLAVEQPGKRRAVVRIEGEYLTDDGKRNAAGVVYFHFYAGLPWARISHKFIVTENSNQLWFKDIGVALPVALKDSTTATFNSDHANMQSAFPSSLKPGQEIVMVQNEFPHFGSTNSHYSITASGKVLQAGLACGDWADVSSKRAGIAAQLPGFSEQFPKAFRVSSTNLTIKLWAAESGKELDYRTAQIIKNYFGHDWIPETDPCMKSPNAGHGTAKIHELWLYPHAGSLAKETIAQFGATREEIYAAIDPSWVARTEVMGPFHPKDTKRFPEAEAVISDYFDRSVLAGNKIFPAQGYLYWGMYPYSAQPWELKNGRWYPTIHRLARSLEYNLKRGVWLLYARSSERKYFDYARRYTRLCGNLLFANSTSPAKPAGWMVQGTFHSPIVWGQFGSTDTDKEMKHKMDSGAMCIAFASSEDVIQFVYDWFLTGDLHSRDMALLWNEAMLKEMNGDVDKALQFYPPEAFLRVLGSGYELDHDPRLLDYGSKITKRRVLCDGKFILNPDVPTNFGKEGEVFVDYYYYHVATGDPLARKALVEWAKFRYQHAPLDQFFSRSSPLQQAFAFAFRDTGDETYARYAIQAANDYTRNYESLKDQGVDLDKLSPATTNEWGHQTMTGQGPIHVGIPVALRLAAERANSNPPVPYAIKPHPTQRTHILLKKETAGTAMLDVFVNNWGDRTIEPKLFDAQGKPARLEVVQRVYDRIDKPDCFSASSIWYMAYEDQIFYKLRIPDAPPGVYELDLGSEVDFTILRSDVNSILQVAPKGTVLASGSRYYFPIPKEAEAVEYFAYRPVRLYDPDGKVVASESIGEANFRFPTKGKPGAWAIEGGTDDLIRQKNACVETFVRMDKVVLGGKSETHPPLVLALGDPKRLFEVDTAKYAQPPVVVEGKTEPEPPYIESQAGFGQSARLAGRFAEIVHPTDSGGGEFPHKRGTIEFWFRPMWSATDCHLIGGTFPSTIRVILYKALPVQIAYYIDPDNGGRTSRYNTAFLSASFEGFGNTKARVFFEAGKWYHVAVTWNVDGKNNDAHIFINGRKRAFAHYDNTLPAKKDPSELKPPGPAIRFGSAHLHGRIPAGEDFDELRISRSIRYVKDFEPPTIPFQNDTDTYLLMHLDGNEETLVNGKPIAAKWLRGKNM